MVRWKRDVRRKGNDQPLQQGPADGGWKSCIPLAVRFKKPRDDGFPDSSEMGELNDVEDEIGRRFCGGNEWLFAGVITRRGMREFVLYTSNESAAIEKGKKLAAEITHYEDQFVLNRDPEWNVYQSFASK